MKTISSTLPAVLLQLALLSISASSAHVSNDNYLPRAPLDPGSSAGATGGQGQQGTPELPPHIGVKSVFDQSVGDGKVAKVRIDLKEGVSGMIGWNEDGKREWIKGMDTLDDLQYPLRKVGKLRGAEGAYLLFDTGPRDFMIKSEKEILECTLEEAKDPVYKWDPEVVVNFPFSLRSDGRIQQESCASLFDFIVKCNIRGEVNERPACTDERLLRRLDRSSRTEASATDPA